MSRKKCVYCNHEITTPSREHVIQNALGGLYESEDICCPGCNNYISRQIDMPFTTIFNPIIGSFSNLTKTHNKNSTPVYKGTVKYKGKEYDANFKNAKVVSCPGLSQELRCDISKLPLEIVSYQFNVNNDAFRTGIAKIAFNYALASGVDFKLIQSGLNVAKSGDNVTKIEYNYPIVPFFPMNALDAFLELGTPTELYHNMILFSQHNRLWCYVDLFNTFQYYVLLSDKFPQGQNVYNNYAQTLKRVPRPEELQIFRPKDALIYAQEYGVEPTMDPQELVKRIKNADLNKPPLEKLISKRMAHMSPFSPMLANISPQQRISLMQAITCYFGEDEDGNETFTQENFRTWTPVTDGNKMMPYPDAIMQAIAPDATQLQQYTNAKFNKLNAFLVNRGK